MKDKLSLPKGWELIRLDSVIKTFIVPQRDRPKTFDGNIPWCRIEDIDGIYLSKSKIGLCVTKEVVKTMPLRVYPKGTVIVSCSADLGRCAIIATPLVTNQTFIGLVPSEKIDSLYLYYLMGSKSKMLNNLATGATIKYLSKNKFQELEIPLPPLPEQQRIVSILDKAFSAIERSRNNAEQNLKNAKELFESYLQGVFENKGEDWEEKTILDLCAGKENIVGGPFGSNLKVEHYRSSGVPILRLQNIGKGYFIDKDIKYVSKEKAKELEYHSFQSGDIALAKLGIPIGKTCIIPDNFEFGIVVADVVRIRPNKKKVDYDFLNYFLNTNLSVSQLTKNISGATRPRVNLDDVRNIVISIPPLKEQQTIVQKLDALSTETKKLEAIYQQKINDLEELKKSILQKAFCGELKTNAVAV